MVRSALIVGLASAAVAAGSAFTSFHSFNGEADLTPGQWEQVLTLGGITFAVCFLAALAFSRAFRTPRSLPIRFFQGAGFGIVTVAAVIVIYSALNSGGDFVTTLLAYADIALWFGGTAVPVVAGLSAVAFAVAQRAGARAGPAADTAPSPRG